MKRSRVLLLGTLVSLALLFSGCGTNSTSSNAPSTKTPKGPVIVASKIDTEGGLLGKMISLVLEANGFTVTDKTGLGTTDVVRKAILNNEIDIYPEYTGNGGFFFENTDPSIWKNAQKGFDEVKKLDKEKNNLVWLTPAKANNTWAIAMKKDVAEQEELVTLEDLAAYINRGGEVKLAGSEEFVTRPDALPSFQKAYGFTLKKSQLITLAGGNTAQTEKALADGTEDVNLAMAYGTDGALAALGLVVLEDTKGVQPVYEPAAVVRNEILAKYPEIAEILKPVFASLDLATLQELNAKIAVEGQDPAAVAKEYLISKDLIKK